MDATDSRLGFQSTLSVRRATSDDSAGVGCQSISIHALREESDTVVCDIPARRVISIHALREESDTCGADYAKRLPISIHALREESDFSVIFALCDTLTFQSTLSVRRATAAWLIRKRLILRFQSTLSVRRATVFHVAHFITIVISIHALREESDFGSSADSGWRVISIHALREESDKARKPTLTNSTNFNPRSP